MNKALFLDRDGTLIRDTGYLSRPEEIEWLSETLETLKAASDNGYLLIIITNQSGIGRGMYSEEQYEKVTTVLQQQAAAAGVHFARIYHCPHWPEADGPCSCRKPEAGLFETAIREHDIDVAQSWAVGDRERDLEPAQQVGIEHVLKLEANQGLQPLREALRV